jgi:hypothetical protein
MSINDAQCISIELAFGFCALSVLNLVSDFCFFLGGRGEWGAVDNFFTGKR